ncbi:MAG: imidazole glycerol phosphate synthase subunit HisH [Planctomycetes bacterium]|nr:imidazole glycerol phosphate synthase subunit HisH [Planctomycetota bacterium]
MITIVDSGTSNLRSLQNALRRLGWESEVRQAPPSAASTLILPGVGAFGHAAESLQLNGWHEWLRSAAASGARLVGICLGMQLLFESSEESPGAEGLGILKGRVRRLNARKVPHIGWARLRGVDALPWAYFAHSYVAEPADPSIVSGWARYGEEWPAVVRAGNVAGVQFHPEKSQGPGLAYLRTLLGDGS